MALSGDRRNSKDVGLERVFSSPCSPAEPVTRHQFGGCVERRKAYGVQRSFLNNLFLMKLNADPVAARSEARALIARTLDRGFESCLSHGCLSSSFYVVLSCAGRGLATSLSVVQGVLPHVEID
jgi:hypothetical protein